MKWLYFTQFYFLESSFYPLIFLAIIFPYLNQKKYQNLETFYAVHIPTTARVFPYLVIMQICNNQI